MKIVLASRNAKKIKELETLLAQHSSMHIEVLSLDDIGYTEEIVEDGTYDELIALGGRFADLVERQRLDA